MNHHKHTTTPTFWCYPPGTILRSSPNLRVLNIGEALLVEKGFAALWARRRFSTAASLPCQSMLITRSKIVHKRSKLPLLFARKNIPGLHKLPFLVKIYLQGGSSVGVYRLPSMEPLGGPVASSSNGKTVNLHGDLLVVSEESENALAGQVRLLKRNGDGGNWTDVLTLPAPAPAGRFGWVTSLSDDGLRRLPMLGSGMISNGVWWLCTRRTRPMEVGVCWDNRCLVTRLATNLVSPWL